MPSNPDRLVRVMSRESARIVTWSNSWRSARRSSLVCRCHTSSAVYSGTLWRTPWQVRGLGREDRAEALEDRTFGAVGVLQHEQRVPSAPFSVFAEQVEHVVQEPLSAVVDVRLEVEGHLQAVVPHHVHDGVDRAVLVAVRSPPAQVHRAGAALDDPPRVPFERRGGARVVGPERG